MEDQHLISIIIWIATGAWDSVINFLDTLRICFEDIVLGKVVLFPKPDQKQKEGLVAALKKQEFEILQSNELEIVTAVKTS